MGPASSLPSQPGRLHYFENWRSTRELPLMRPCQRCSATGMTRCRAIRYSGRLSVAQRFSGPFPRLCRTCSLIAHLAERDGYYKWLPHMDSHHDDRRNRPTGSFTSQGKMKMAPAPGFEPGTAAVRSSACKMIRYTLRACFGKMVGHPGYAPGVSRSQAERIRYLPRARGCESAIRRIASQILAVATGAAPAVSCLTSKRVCCSSSRPGEWPTTRRHSIKWCGVTVMLRAGQ